MIIESITDGINHINAYSKGKTKLGRMLSNFEHSPFTHSQLDDFESMEGIWYYISTGMKIEELRKLYGFEAKQLGRKFPLILNMNFEVLIYEGLECKLVQNDHILLECNKNYLPYYHYYVLNGKPIKLDESFFIQALRKNYSEIVVDLLIKQKLRLL